MTSTWHALLTLAFATALGSSPLGALGQSAVACPGPDEIEAVHLYGLWQLSLWAEEGQPSAPVARGVVLFERHPDYPGGVRGLLRLTEAELPQQAQVSGDVADGLFTLDESADGVRMSAVWEGVPEDCGRRIRGSRRPAEGQADQPTRLFRLERSRGWD